MRSAARRIRLGIAFIIAFALPLPSAAQDLTIGVSLDGGAGAHLENGTKASSSAVAAPFIEASYGLARWQVHVEGLVPITASFNGNGLGLRSILASYDDGSVRYRFGDFAIGAGETLWNQRSFYAISSSAQQTDASRGVGMRLEALAHLPTGRSSMLEFMFSDTPAMRAALSYTLAPYPIPLHAQGETGSLIDTDVQDVIQSRHSEFYYGVRYLRLNMWLSPTILADGDSIWAAYAGLAWHER